MQKTSYNLIFVYGLLVVDLLVNITDNLFSASRHHGDGTTIMFVIVLIQIISIICVVIDLVLHFFETSDQVRKFAWNQRCRAGSEIVRVGDVCPMPQRLALKLVLDKYWWSLLVGLLYLVLTIILQTVRLDPSWHNHRSSVVAVKANLMDEALVDESIFGRNLLERENHGILSEMSNSITSKLPSPEAVPSASNPNLAASTTNINLLPIIVLLIHKLMSTCYYVSFVVVYRANPSQMVNRILFVNKSAHHQIRHESQ